MSQIKIGEEKQDIAGLKTVDDEKRIELKSSGEVLAQAT